MSHPTGRCLVCNSGLSAALVWCAECETPTDRECFIYSGRCPVYACTGMRFRDGPDGPALTLIPAADTAQEAGPQALIIDHSPRRRIVLLALGVTSLVLAFCLIQNKPSMGRRVSAPLELVLCPAVVGLVMIGLSRLTHDYWVIDSKTGCVWLHRKIGRWRSLLMKTTFKDCERLVLHGRVVLNSTHYMQADWTLRLYTRSRCLSLSDGIRVRYPPAAQPVRTMSPPARLRSSSEDAAKVLGLALEIEIDPGRGRL
jgi:hypothetical protein